MNMEDCPVHKAEANPPYPFTCSCPEEGYNDWNWKNLALAEYHGWAAWGEYHPWVRENSKGHDRYVKMLWDYQQVALQMYRKWLLRDIAKKVQEGDLSAAEILELLETSATEEYYEGIEDREED